MTAFCRYARVFLQVQILRGIFFITLAHFLNSTALRAVEGVVTNVDIMPSFTRDGQPGPSRYDAGPNGTAFVSGNFDHVGEIARYRLAKLNNHLAQDESFDPGLVMTNFLFARVRAMPDGGAVIVDSTRNSFYRFIRSRPDGSKDPNYVTPLIQLLTNGLSEPFLLVHTNGEVTFLGGIANEPTLGLVCRLRADGSLGQCIQPFFSDPASYYLGLAAQGEKLIVLGASRTNLASHVYNLVLVRLNYDLTPDETFTSPVLGDYKFFLLYFLSVERNGRIIVGSDRFMPDGAFDVQLERPPFTDSGTGLSLPDNRILTAAGELLDANGQFQKQLPFSGRKTLLSDDNTILSGGSYFRLRPTGPTTLEIPTGAPSNFQIIARGEPNQIVRLETSPDLRQWTEDAAITAIQFPVVTFTNRAPTSNTFFRLRVQGLTE